MDDKIVTKGLNAYFGDVHAVKGIDIRIPKNAITAIIGPSGCGKSTLIRCMNRMHEVVRGARVTGEVLLDGRDIYSSQMDPVLVRTKVGMVFQKPNPFPTMSIYDNVVAGLRLNGEKDWKRLDATVERSLKLAALWDEVKHQLDASGVSISGGQQQRLCIARALAVQPEALLLDEPCSALDPIATAKIEDLLFDLKDKYTIVIVTHNMQQAARVADFTAFMYMGELIEFGVTKKIFENPDKELTEKYITGRFG
ncbi:MAG: phosphate ABC transporter ATP-binding protein PstB [Thermoplasmatota archaeon]|nr:phosphate ABC transporter ATP-binding protein [Candidatus Thermoplasmatota archaeon]MBU1914259.1 phosphate ABC transporter ATP-binding protein [Candidatus Thermoplasmatota archaeon]